jgi:hypothetical protein
MTVLGAVVFGGILALGVLWLLVTAPGSDVDQAWSELEWNQHVDPVGAAAAGSGVLTH